MTDWPVHPAAAVWPMLHDDEIDALAKSIAEAGLIHPLVTWTDAEGVTWLLDGRNRLAACIRAGVLPTVTQYAGDDPALYVLAANEHRRHATPSQRAMAVASTATARVGGDHSAEMRNGATSADAAHRAGVSTRLVEACRFVREHAPELVDAVLAGTIKATAAEAEARRKVAEHQRLLAARAEIAATDELIRRDAPDLADRLLEEDVERDEVLTEYRSRIAQTTTIADRWRGALLTLEEAAITLSKIDPAALELAARHQHGIDSRVFATAYVAAKNAAQRIRPYAQEDSDA